MLAARRRARRRARGSARRAGPAACAPGARSRAACSPAARISRASSAGSRSRARSSSRAHASAVPRITGPQPRIPAATAPCSDSGSAESVIRAATLVGIIPCSAIATSSRSRKKRCSSVGSSPVSSRWKYSVKLEAAHHVAREVAAADLHPIGVGLADAADGGPGLTDHAARPDAMGGRLHGQGVSRPGGACWPHVLAHPRSTHHARRRGPGHRRRRRRPLRRGAERPRLRRRRDRARRAGVRRLVRDGAGRRALRARGHGRAPVDAGQPARVLHRDLRAVRGPGRRRADVGRRLAVRQRAAGPRAW